MLSMIIALSVVVVLLMVAQWISFVDGNTMRQAAAEERDRAIADERIYANSIAGTIRSRMAELFLAQATRIDEMETDVASHAKWMQEAGATVVHHSEILAEYGELNKRNEFALSIHASRLDDYMKRLSALEVTAAKMTDLDRLSGEVGEIGGIFREQAASIQNLDRRTEVQDLQIAISRHTARLSAAENMLVTLATSKPAEPEKETNPRVIRNFSTARQHASSEKI